jgi:hypothetical protein
MNIEQGISNIEINSQRSTRPLNFEIQYFTSSNIHYFQQYALICLLNLLTNANSFRTVRTIY